MKSTLTVFSLLALLFISFGFTKEAEAACVIRGQYYSDAECAQYRNQNTYQNTYNYSYTTGANEADRIALLQQTIQQLLLLLEQLRALQGGTTYITPTPIFGNSQVDVTTRSAREIDDDRATLRGEVDFNNEDEATVYFQYGRSRNDLYRETVHIVLDDNDDEEFSQRIIDLRRDTDYYFRAVAEDEQGREDYGSILSFNTDDRRSSRDDDEPDVNTEEAEDIDDDSAELHGEVDMNDFNNGKVFFVYGEDEDLVEEIEDEYEEYNDIDEEGDDLQKEVVDNDLDGDQSYWEKVVSLDNDTDIFFSICVEYEDEDDDPVIKCGSVEEFTTDD